jgi:hypothetical protein
VVKIDSPDPRGCAVTEPWITAVRGLASYTVPKLDVLVSATFRSLRTTIPFLQANNSATNGASLAANLLNTNDPAGYEQTFDYATQGASWLRPTSIVPPRFARVNVTLNF